MADVFISYKSERRAAAEHLAEILADYGYSVWWDYGLISGRDFGAQIEKELRASKAVVVLWCSMAIESEWVREEAGLAKRLNKVIPTFIEKVELPLGFSLSQTLDLSQWDGAPQSNRLERLLRDIAQLVGRPAKPNLEGLDRTERAWRRFGAPPLREFALIDALERKLPPRTLPGALFSQNESRAPQAEPEPPPRKPPVALLGTVGALAAAAIIAFVLFGRGGPSQSEASSSAPQIDMTSLADAMKGKWQPAGLTCDEAVTIAASDGKLMVDYGGGAPNSETIAGREPDGSLRTSADGGASFFYSVDGDKLTVRDPTGQTAVYTKCAG